ncbi:MAG: pentapeptide repeat-containing protein [Rhodospirillales bacterium]
MTEEDSETPADPPVLKGAHAVALWKKGRGAWNDYIDAHPGTEIDFSDVDFSQHRKEGEPLSFKDFRFGVGDVFFQGAIFDDGDVTFELAVFEGSVSFNGAAFGTGEVSFSDTTFGDGGAFFSFVNFGDGNLLFFRAVFGDGLVSFYGATFGDGDVFFSRAKFGDSHVLFTHVQFGSQRLLFHDVSMSRVDFSPIRLQAHSLDCSSMTVSRTAHFDLSLASIQLEEISFRDAVFDGPFTLSGTLAAAPDLRGTKTVHHVELSGLRATLRRTWPRLAWPIILSRIVPDRKAAVADAARFRRLKEIAEANRDHAAALRFAADENRARRWHETGWFASVLDMLFSGFSDYGQSIWRPVAGLAALTALATVLFKTIAKTGDWGDAVSLAAGNAFAFLPQSRSVRDGAVDGLFPSDPGM